MRGFLRYFVLSLLIFVGVGTANAQSSYSTTFSGTENPISESSKWVNGGTTATHWQNMQTFGGHVGGTGVNPGCSNPSPNINCNDGVANLTGNYGAKQHACAIVYINGVSRTSGTYEIELHLHQTTTSGNTTGYEFNYSLFNNGNQYMQIVRWNGFVGGSISFTGIGGTSGTPVALQNGDLFCASDPGTGQLQSTLTRPGQGVIQTANLSGGPDTTFTGGAPGIGSFNGAGVVGDNANFGFSSFSAQGAGSTPACYVENFTDFESGSSGNVVTPTIMASSTHGYSTGTWAVQEDNNPGNITLASGANQPLNQATGILCGNSTSYPAGAGSLGVQFTGTGVAGSHSITYNLPAQFQLPQLQAGIWFCSDLPASDGSIPDIMGIESSSSDFAGVNFDGNGLPNGRYFKLETVNGYGIGGPGAQPPIFVPTGSCPLYPTLGSDWLHLIVNLGQVNVAPSTLNVYNVSGNLVGTITVPASFIQNNGHATSTSIGCPANNTSSVTTGLHCFFDSWQIADPSVPISPQLQQPICTATGLTPALVQAAINPCLAGGTVVLPYPFGSGTWGGTQITVPMTGTGPVTIQGQSICTGGCSPGSQGIGLVEVDNTTISTSVTSNSLTISGCSTLSPFRLTGITFNNTGAAGTLIGVVQTNCPHGQTNTFRLDHLHVTNAGGSFFVGNDGWGLNDHILGTLNAGAYSYWILNGNFNSGGQLDWEDPTHIGTAENTILEDSNFTSPTHIALTDGNFGCKGLIRHNQFNGTPGGQTHGTDSGGFFSCVGVDIDSNHFTSTGCCFSPWNGSRGGYVLYHGNINDGSALWSPLELDYFRVALPNNPGVPGYGLARSGLQFSPSAAINNSNTTTLNPQAPAWIGGHAYATGALVNFGAACNVSGSTQLFTGNAQATVGGTSGGSVPPCLVSGNTETDGGVTWIGIGGQATAPLGTFGTNAGFLSTDFETPCTSGVNCTRYFDSPGYPYRDQPCLIHGQITGWCYQWGNSGSQFPTGGNLGAPWNTDALSILQLNRDVFNATPAGYGAGYTYPDPLQGSAPPPGTISFNPSSFNFGGVAVGCSPSCPTQSFVLSNTTSSFITITGTSFSSSVGFSQTNNCSSTLANGASCTYVVTFTPAAGGSVSANLQVAYTGVTGSPAIAGLSGTGNLGPPLPPTSFTGVVQ